MAGIGILSLHGASGYKYSFEIYNFGDKLEPESGIYVITRRYIAPGTSNYRHTIIFIGHTDDLSFDFDQHEMVDCFNMHAANCICIQIDENKQSRQRKQKDLVDHIKPKCNT